MADISTLKKLAHYAATKTAPAEYANKNVDIDQAFCDELNKFAGSINQFMKNRYDLYEIVIENADEITPKKVIDVLGAFAEVKVVPNNQRVIFKRSNLASKRRAKTFLTQVGLSGIYETFRLDNSSFEVQAHAVGIACTLDFERMLDGTESLSEYMDAMTEANTESVFLEVQKALKAKASDTTVTEGNFITNSSWDSKVAMKLIAKIRAYGTGVAIFAPPEFIAEMGADAIVPAGTSYAGVYHPDDIDAIHNTGFIKIFRGCPVIEIPQSFVDEHNDKTVIVPNIAYFFPTGKEKIVKVVLEGQTQIWDLKNADQSLEIQMYRKIGVAILTDYNWGLYKNLAITDTSV